MLRKLLIGFGLVEIARPRPIIRACELIGLENPNEAQLRPWAIAMARLEGFLFVWLLARGRKSSTLASTLLGVGGVILAVVPQPIIVLSQAMVYENTADLEWKPYVVPAARLLGIVYVTVALLSRATGSAEAERPEPRAERSGEESTSKPLLRA
ncbi:hypothetical protein ACFQGT_13120 [Natrialbaceae archaeon GCM10025810]|uniref:hypothetical protein n=1 Tax=Halovalidus salilacus TaxID=3075124 RepID=UPI0036185EF5